MRDWHIFKMAGKKEKSKKKSKQPMSRIGTALFPRAMFAAVPRSPEPPKDVPEEHNPSALASALLNSTLVGRVIATPSPESTLRTPRHDENGDGSSPVQEAGNASLANSMARSSMYDYDDSDEEDEDDDPEDQYSRVPIRKQNDHTNTSPSGQNGGRNTMSNRARMDTPPMMNEVESDSDTMLSRSENDDDHIPHLDTSGSREPSPASPKTRKTSDHIYLAPRSDLKINMTNGHQTPEPKKTDVYAHPRKADKELPRPGSSQSPSSSLTGVSSQVDDFSDLITPPPPWKRKKEKKKKGNKSDRTTPEVTEDRITPVSRMEESSTYKSPIAEPVIEAMQVQSMEHVPPDVTDGIPPHPLQESYNYSQRPGTSASHASNTEEDYLRLTNLRLEQELDLVQKERQQLLETLQQQTQTLGKLQSVQASLSPARKTTSPTQGKREIKELQQSLQMKVRENELQEEEYSAKLDELVQKCEKFKKENQAIREVNDQLHHENHSLKQLSTSIKDENSLSNRALQQQAEDVIEENDQLKNIIHKLNVQLSRYQAKCPTPQKGDPPGLPARGGTPRWLTDTKYLSPLIVAYEDMVKDKQDIIELCQRDLETLRKEAEDIVQENQRLHSKIDQMGQPSSVTSSEWNQVQEQARLVLEENQVVMTQLDIQQKKLKDANRNHAQEVARLGKRIAMVEAEKNQVEGEMSDLQHKYSALKQQHDRTIVNNERKMPIQEHMDTIGEYKRSMDELHRTHEDELENLRSKLTSVQSEKKNVAMKLAEMHAEKSQMEGEIRALNKAQKKISHKFGYLERELQDAELREANANKHLNKVLAIAEQTAAERDSLEKMVKAQAQEKKKAMNKMMDSNITIGRMEEKLKMYKLRAEEKMGQLSLQMEDQEGSHSSRLRQYDRQVKHLQQLLQDKQDVLDSISYDKKKVEDQLETVWQTATADNKRMQAKLARSMRGSMKSSLDGRPFGSDSDNVGLLSSESD